jgi:hypothetical protein
MKNVNKIIAWKYEGKRSAERTINKYGDDIKMGFK